MIQLPGGIGFTWEHEAHRYFKAPGSLTQLFDGDKGAEIHPYREGYSGISSSRLRQ
jgi:hypothetical protein